eukprot:2097196-Rhodomonas_salina.2
MGHVSHCVSDTKPVRSTSMTMKALSSWVSHRHRRREGTGAEKAQVVSIQSNLGLANSPGGLEAGF